ncbi:PPR domain-containing protein/PPR_1 domain-containing protein/PPR_2 domain-containing protein, partial [Cephalotus follicularis]
SSLAFSLLINGLCIRGRLLQAVRLFGACIPSAPSAQIISPLEGVEPDAFSYNTIVNGLCKIGNTNAAIKLFKKMEQRGVELDLVTYNAIIDSLCKDKVIADTFNLFSELKNIAISPNCVTYSSLIHGVCNLGKWKEATKLLNVMVATKFSADVSTAEMIFNLLLDGEGLFDAH